uniref:DOMON domain-containing protein n=1 Tax=Rhipicephalus appendiculatus TaxID=34631 RepID=A0A131YY35_RHIAP
MFVAVVMFVCAALSVGEGDSSAPAYQNGFDKSACQTLCPVPGCPDNASADTELKLSERGFPLASSFQFPEKIRRQSPFRVNMSSPNVAVNALILAFRSRTTGGTEPQGYFDSWSDSLKPLKCDGDGPPNALTNKDLSGKNDFWFSWMPPKAQEIDVALRGTFVVNNEYWYNIEIKSDFKVNEFPVSMEGCGETKSCVTLSRTRTKCEKASRCDLTVAYSLSADNRTLEVTMGGVASMAGRYLAIAFTNDSESLKSSNIFACIRTERLAEVRHFTLSDDKSVPVESNQVLEDTLFEQDGELVWCRFKVPVRPPNFDLSVPLYQVYFWGEANRTSGQIEMSPPYKTSKEPIQVGVAQHSRLTSASSRESAPVLAVLVSGLMAAILLRPMS